ncbi:TonB-dependent receptor plug domain-containing protein [Desulfobacula phenolica]|uniref:Outer membrane receptor proteins, mostly Fe transport n=1 Tax=Desulfobacula phenolica TaxID=90732 RepID=A0A1H2IC67_9BACT|nr:TonB-dependent receptor [Desulfobacula phenolica]SDU41707.1 Outer membrane receptor proteins, mostly Fe transport [Desulfobacula phenolica]
MKKERKGILCCLALVVTFLFCGVCLAYDQSLKNEPDDAVDLGEVVVSATKSEKMIVDTPVSISVIKKDELDQAPNVTIDEAFRYTPSVQVIRGEGIGTTHNFINIRGIGTKRNLLYVDGVNMVESMSGNTTLSLLPTQGVEKIEILRGPSSALYGGRGMSGVINMFSSPPEKGVKGCVKSFFGNYDFKKYNTNISYGSDKWGIALDASNTGTDNYWSRDNMIKRTYDYRSGDYSYDFDADYEKSDHVGWENWNRDYEEKSIQPKIFLTPNDDTRITVSMGYMENETGNGYTDRYTDANGNDVEKYLEKDKEFIGLSGKTNLSDSSNISYRLTYHHLESKNTGENMDLAKSLDDPAQLAPGGRAPQFYRSESSQGSKDYEFELSYSKSLTSQMLGDHNLTVGMQYQSNNVYWSIQEQGTGRSLTNPVDTTKTGYSLYLQDEYFINDKFTLTSGLRGDMYDEFDEQLSPKLALHFKPNPDTQYFISSGYAFNPPSYSQKFGTDWNMTAYTIRTNNSNLDAEKLWSAEIGVRKRFKENLNCSLSAYYAEARDLIESIKEKKKIGGSNKVTMTYEYHDNIDRAVMQGIESEITYDFNKHHHLTGSFSIMDAENAQTDKKLPQIPEMMGSIAYQYNRDFNLFGQEHKFWSTVRGRGQNAFLIEEYSVDEPKEVSGFFVVDLSMGIDVAKHAKLFLNATNLFDKDYREFTYTRYQSGRMVMFGAEIYF